MSDEQSALARTLAALLPATTPVGKLPLRPGTIRALEAGGIRTLGRLRQASDAGLLELRRFSPRVLAEVRVLVPPPGGSDAA